MVDRLKRWRNDRLLQWVIGLIGLHSCILGTVMLVAPRLMLRTFGFPESIPLFFPSQSGVFLAILGVCYLRALAEPSFVGVIQYSKAFAVFFLFVHAAFLQAPPIIGAAGAGDGMMLVILSAVLYRHRKSAKAIVNGSSAEAS